MADGLHHGINVYAYDGELNIGDLRVWRSRQRPDFGKKEALVLDTLLPYFRNALQNARIFDRTCEKSEMWERLLEATGIAVYLFDTSGRIVHRNGEARVIEEKLPAPQSISLLNVVRSLALMDLSITQWGPYSLSVMDLFPPEKTRRYRAVVARGLGGGRMDRAFLMSRFRLSQREADICLLVCKGLTDLEIARVLGVAFATIRTHLKRIFIKVDVSTRSELTSRLFEDLVEVIF
jgi:DNA-binding CsgD family transcriptional regulator